jgi:hypothetical protein
MNLKAIAQRIDTLFGLKSQWTFNRGVGCYESKGVINIDEDELNQVLASAALPTGDLERLATFVMGHEKGHHVQEKVSPARDYQNETRVMEIEADLFGAWVLHRRSLPTTAELVQATKHFSDVNRMSRPVGGAIGDPSGSKSTDYPWPEQREMALARGRTLATLYTPREVARGLSKFAADVSAVARSNEFTL